MRRMRVLNNNRASGVRPPRRFKTDMMNQSRSRIRLKVDFRHLLIDESHKPELSSFESFKCAVEFPPFYHFLAVSVQSVIHNPLRCVHFVIVFKAEVSEAFRDGTQTRAFRLVPERVISIGAVDYFPEQVQRWIRG